MTKIIAIVDDDESFRGAISNLIRSLGYSVMSFGSAEEFLESECLAETACLITDVHMSGMSGLELQGTLLARRSRVPVIVATAGSGSNTRGQALALGALAFLTKPFAAEKLLSCVGLALSRQPV